jgi:GT2 family glycosyltransferase
MKSFPVWAVVLNHREAADTIRCLRALDKVRYRRLTPLVVDNASGPGEVAWLRSLGATVVESGGNPGYAGGNNIGISFALERGAEAVWLVNPDAYVHRWSLRRLVRALRRHPEVGIVGPRILEAESATPKVQSDGGRIVWEVGGRSELIGRGNAPNRGGGLRFVDFVPGAAMLVRRRVFEDIGLLPEEFFLYFEETEFCVRAAAAGWKVAVETGAQAVHRFASADGLPGETLLYYFVRNRLLFGQRHTEVPFEEQLADLEGFIASWRRRVQERNPRWLGRFEELVAMAVADARAGVTGRREGVGAG